MKLKPFQREDLARMALVPGAINAKHTGLGKTFDIYLYPALRLGFYRPGDRVAQASEPAVSQTSESANLGKRPFGLHPKGSVLIVAPGDGHDQIIDEGRTHFATSVTRLDCQATFLRLAAIDGWPTAKSRYRLPHGYYICSYTQLAHNGVAEFPQLKRDNPEAEFERWHQTDAGLKEFLAAIPSIYRNEFNLLGLDPAQFSAPNLRRAWFQLRKNYVDDNIRGHLDRAYYTLEPFAPGRPGGAVSPAHRDKVLLAYLEIIQGQFKAGIGEVRWVGKPSPASHSSLKVKCVYSPSLADLSQDAFDAVVVDEGTHIKGEDTIIGTGVRQMVPRQARMICSATPIKNRLPDIFRLAWWSAGALPDPHPRFPFADSIEARTDFTESFMVSERNLSAEARAAIEGRGRPRVKLTPQVCNIHRLWKFLGPLISRRTKNSLSAEDLGTNPNGGPMQIVSKHRHVVRVPMGLHQTAVYQYHLEAQYKDKNDKPAVGAKLQALRIAAANPASTLLEPVTNFPSLSPSGGERVGVRGSSIHQSTNPSFRSRFPYTPKLDAVLHLLNRILKDREQVIVFSAFHDSLDALSAHLNQAGVAHLVLDGRCSQTKRARLAREFKKGPPVAQTSESANARRCHSCYPVMLASVECMAELHSFHLCRNIILMAYSWAYDKFEQAINRIHRLNSPDDVRVYSVLCDGSIDRKLESLIDEKGDAAELVLDGKLFGENTSEVNLAELLHVATQEFNSELCNPQSAPDEAELQKAWPALRATLAVAARSWSHGLAIGDCRLAHSPGAPSTLNPQPPLPTVTAATLQPALAARPLCPALARLRRPSPSRPVSHDFADLPLWQQAAAPALAPPIQALTDI